MRLPDELHSNETIGYSLKFLHRFLFICSVGLGTAKCVVIMLLLLFLKQLKIEDITT